MTQTVQIGELIEQRTFSPLQTRVLALCGLVTLYDGFDTQLMALTVPAIAADWGVPHASFGYVLAASLVGMALGAGAIAPLGDRFGRKPMLTWSVLLMGLTTLAMGHAQAPWQLAALRFAVGIGIGVSVANSAAMISDYMPLARRATAVTLAYAVSAIGAIAASALSPLLISTLGWRGVFTSSGIAAIPLILMLAFWLPESMRLLLAKRPSDPRIARLLPMLQRTGDDRIVTADPAVSTAHGRIWDLVSAPYRRRSLTIWAVLMLNSFVVYMVASWLPTLLVLLQWGQSKALYAAAAMQFGGLLGAVAIASAGSRLQFGLAVSFSCAALSLAAMFTVPAASPVWWLLLIAMGAGTSGSACGLIALSSVIYPPEIRATGVGWALLLGRFGAIAAPITGGALISAGLEADLLLGSLAVPALACALTLVFLVPAAWQQGALTK